MKNFVTSDLHFDHANIIEYSPESRGHLYTSGLKRANGRIKVTRDEVVAMNEEIVANFNEGVDEEDHTFILGDIGFGKPADTMRYLKMMNGTKTIIHGNHDRSLVKSSIFQETSQRRLAGIVEDTPYKVITVDHGDAKYGVILFHFRIASWDGAHHGSIHLYGHEHGNGPVMDTRCMDIGIDTNAMRPYNLNDVVEKLSTREITKNGHHDGTR